MKLKRIVKQFLPVQLIRRYENELRKETHINRALSHANGPTTYVEIGVRDGACIAQISATRKIAVDPAPINAWQIRRDGTIVCELTSDEFFASASTELIGAARVDVALVDGLHEFRQTLRDVLNLERHMSPDGVIFIHDCNPPSRRHVEDMTGPWNGDVWKVAPYLIRFRPDLTYFTLDCDWGLGVVTGFSADAPQTDQDQVDQIAQMDYAELERDRDSILRLRSAIAHSMRDLSRTMRRRVS